MGLNRLEVRRLSRRWGTEAPTGGGTSGVSSFNTRTGAVSLTSGDVTTALGFTPQVAGSYLTANQTITLNGDATGSGATAITVTIGANKVTRSMLAATSGATILGATAAGNVSDLTAAQAKSFLAITASDVSGLAAIATSGSASDLSTGFIPSGRFASGIIALSNIQLINAGNLLGNNGGSAASPSMLTASQVKTMLAITEADVSGLTTDLASKAPLANPQHTGVAFFQQPSPTAKTATGTLTIADLLTLIITVTSATAVSLTLPTGTLTDAGILSGGLAINEGFEWVIINTGSSSGAVTLVAGTGHTIVGQAVTPISSTTVSGVSRWFTRKTASNTFVTYRIG